MTRDVLAKVAGALLQHGPDSDRVYLMKLGSAAPEPVLDAIDGLVADHGYTKVFAKIPESAWGAFKARGYGIEAAVPGLFPEDVAGLFLGRYHDPSRQHPADPAAIAEVIRIAEGKGARAPGELPDDCAMTEMGEEHVEEMAALYDHVFDSYPFPIDDPAYLLATMRDNVRYFGVRREGRLIALSSAEMDRESANVEMTDLATRRSCRSQGLAGILLAHMEQAMVEEGFSCAYTIARALSYGVNILFARGGYSHGGTLPNNTQIGGGLESMNVWYKRLS